jgi:hypothetical protein
MGVNGNGRIELPTINDLDESVNGALAAASKAGLQECVILGKARDGGIYFTSSMKYIPDILWLLMVAKDELMAESRIDD